MRTSYREDDVVFLLKDITGMVEPQPTEEREKLIQAGRHYCEMLPIEYTPSEAYMEAYQEALENYAAPTALAIGVLADKIIAQKGSRIVLVSLARAGTPIGILLKRYIWRTYHIAVKHYSISIIRGKGIDRNAMKFLLERHLPEELLFVDGWIGKGAILKELRKEIAAFPGVSDEIAVVADPAKVTKLCGTHEDILIPSSCLNSTVSGLVSRTFLRDDIIGEQDFHGAVYYGELKDVDLSYGFIAAIEKEFPLLSKGSLQEKRANAERAPREAAEDAAANPAGLQECPRDGLEEAVQIADKFGVSDLNFIKPGIGETTRVLLRRVPWKILVSSRLKGDKALAHIVKLAQEKGVPIEYYPLYHYKSCGIIRQMADL
ncbi:cysteine protease StiP family protein [Lachnospiraceae bacterium 29-84]